VAGKPQILDKINRLMDRLDVPTENKIYSSRFILDNRPVTQIDTQVKTMLSEDGSIVTDRETNSLLIVDKVSKVESIQSYLEEIDVPTVKQVRIQTRFVELSDNVSQSLGIDWSAENLSGNVQSRGSFTGDGSVDAADVPSSSGFQLGLIDDAAGNFDIRSRLEALESKSGVDLISSPSLVTRNQQEAVLEVLNEISYLEGCEATQSEGGSIQYTPQVGKAEDGITLSVTPLIGANDIVQMNIEPMLKIVDFSGRVSIESNCGDINFPEVDRRTANLDVALKDGQTLVLGGLSRSEERPSITRVPYLSQIPVMGYLFKNKSQDNEEKEINIFVTVDIIEFQDAGTNGDTPPKYLDEASAKAQKTIGSDTPLF
jgi:type IV pilus assembly protein PilQ